jgi:integrase
MGVVTRRDSPYYWLNLERAGLPPLRESTKLLARGLPEPQLRENRRLAQAIYAARMGDLARTRHKLPIPLQRATFATFATWYLKHVTPTKRTAARERSAIKRLVAILGRRPLDAIDKDAALEYRTARKRQKVKPGTINREVDVLKSMLTSAVPKYLEANPLAGLKRLRARAAPPRLLTREEEAQLLAVLPAEDGALLICALDTCLRLSDVVNLRRDQDRQTTLVIPDPKGEPYKVPISARLRAALDALPVRGRYFFAQHHRGRGARAAQNSAIRMFAKACQAADVPHGRPAGVTFHCLRHTAATRALDAGATLRELMELGGWRDLKSVLRYTRATAADRALVDRMAAGG